MSLADIETAIEDLSAEERLRLYEFLGRKVKTLDERRAEWSRIMREMDAGKKFTSDQVEELVRVLELNGV